MLRLLLISAILLESASGFVPTNICHQWTDDISMKVISSVSRHSKLIQARGNSINSLVNRLVENATSIRENIVDTFSCDGRVYGYYADQDNDCQIFHICIPMQQLFPEMFCAEDIIHFSFICPALTIFNQEAMVCDWTDRAFPCSVADHLYDRNNLMFVVPAEDVQRDSSSVTTTTPASSRPSICCSNKKQTTPAASTVPPDIITDEQGRPEGRSPNKQRNFRVESESEESFNHFPIQQKPVVHSNHEEQSSLLSDQKESESNSEYVVAPVQISEERYPVGHTEEEGDDFLKLSVQQDYSSVNSENRKNHDYLFASETLVQQSQVASSASSQVQAETSNAHQLQTNSKHPDVTYPTVSETEQAQFKYKQQTVVDHTLIDIDQFQSEYKQPDPSHLPITNTNHFQSEHTQTEYATTEELTENINNDNLDDLLITNALPSEEPIMITTPMSDSLTTPTAPVTQPFDIPESTTLIPNHQLSIEGVEKEQATSYYTDIPTAINTQPVHPDNFASNYSISPDSTVLNLSGFTVFETSTSSGSTLGPSNSKQGAASDIDYVTEYIWNHKSHSQTHSGSELMAVGIKQEQMQQGSPDHKPFIPKQTAQSHIQSPSRLPRQPVYPLFMYSKNSGNFYSFQDY